MNNWKTVEDNKKEAQKELTEKGERLSSLYESNAHYKHRPTPKRSWDFWNQRCPSCRHVLPKPESATRVSGSPSYGETFRLFSCTTCDYNIVVKS